jgi:hypothetical protein
MNLPTMFAVMLLSVGFVGSVASAVGVAIGRGTLDQRPEGASDIPMNRWVYTGYSGFTKTGTLVASLFLLLGGILFAVVLLATGEWRLD